MKIIQRPFFLVLLWSAFSAAQDGPLPTSVSEYPLCVQQSLCLSYAATAYCSNDQNIGCVCDRQAVGFFIMLYYCAVNVCSTADLSTAINLVNTECTQRGYNPMSIINQALQTPTFTFSMSGMSDTGMPTSLGLFSFPTAITQSSNPSSNPSSTSKSTATVTAESKSSGAISTAAVIGIVVGGVAVIAIIAGLVVFCMKHRAKQRRLQAMTAVPPPQPPAIQPPQMVQYPGSPPPGYPSYGTPVYTPQQQPITQQQQQPLMQGYQELENPATGYYLANKKADVVSSSVPTTTTTTPAPLPPGNQNQYFQELSAQQTQTQVDPRLAQGHVFAEMPGDYQTRR